MKKVEGTTITMTRGDTLLVRVGMTRDGTDYTPQPGDSVRFAAKTELNRTGTEFKEAYPLILKQIPIDTMVLRLDPEDTKPLAFGNYTYDIEITFASGIVDTFIENARLVLTPEVH